MRLSLSRILIGSLIGVVSSAVTAQTTQPAPGPTTRSVHSPPVVKYVDPTLLDVPWPKHDNYVQPWRGYLEARSGYDFINGVGVVFNETGNVEVAARLLAEAGFKTFRIEVPFGDVSWDGTRLNSHDRVAAVFRQCKASGVRPTILLNAHHGGPCPTISAERKLAAPAKAGDRVIRLADVTDLRPHYSGLSNVGDFWAAGIMFAEIDTATGTCKLSKPLPKDLPADKPLVVSTLKYRPLMPVGTREFDETVDGWLKYVSLIMRMLRETGIDAYDLEIWNELTFGSQFLDADNYYEPKILGPQTSPLHPGGRCWELARRTLDLARLTGPRGVRVIWGFSNTTFFHTGIAQLPAGMDGQSYHPYGTGTRQLEFHEQNKGKPEFRQGPPAPDFDMRLPEGWAITYLQTETLMRILNPAARRSRPKESPRFYHYMTEHGLNGPECDLTDAAATMRLKTKAIVRVFPMWLNKGIDVMHWYCSKHAGWKDFGILPENSAELKPDAKFDDVATPPMKAIRNLTRCFAGSVPLPRYTQLGVEIAELSEPRVIWPGTDKHPPLWERECLAVLPFQASASRFVIPVYVMTYDAVKEHPGSRYRISIRNLPAGVDQASFYDPIADQSIDVKPELKDGVLEIELPIVDYPRVLTLQAKQ